MREKFKLTEVWCKIALIFIFSACYVLAIPFPEKSRQFPQLLAVISLVMTVIALIVDFSRKDTLRGEITGVDDTELKVLDAKTKKARKRRLYQAWAIILVSTGVGFLGGFLFSALCFFAAFALVFGSVEKRVKNMIIAVALTIVVYFVFGRTMGVPLLEGALW